jgi:hypothetical protein
MRHHHRPLTAVGPRVTHRLLSILLVIGLLLTAAAVADAAAPEGATVGPFPDFQQVIPDPCTGQPLSVAFTGNRIVSRRELDGAGHFHEIAILSGKWSAGPYTGTWQNPFIVNDLNFGAFDDFSFTEVTIARGGDGTGTRPILRLLTHLRIVDGLVVASIDQVTARCAGRP